MKSEIVNPRAEFNLEIIFVNIEYLVFPMIMIIVMPSPCTRVAWMFSCRMIRCITGLAISKSGSDLKITTRNYLRNKVYM